MKHFCLLFILLLLQGCCLALEVEPELYWWKDSNFGDYLSKIVVEKILDRPVKRATLQEKHPIFFAIGSVLKLVRPGDIIWGSGFREYPLPSEVNKYKNLDVRAVRGPRSRDLLLNMGVDCPEIYGDPAMLLPILFPHLKKQNPIHKYIIIPHLSENKLFKDRSNVVLTSENWEVIIDKILKSKLVISGSLHGIIVAEAFGVPARLLKVTWTEELLKYQDYYEATGRPHFRYATSLKEAIKMGGEEPPKIDLEPLLQAFPFDCFHQ